MQQTTTNHILTTFASTRTIGSQSALTGQINGFGVNLILWQCQGPETIRKELSSILEITQQYVRCSPLLNTYNEDVNTQVLPQDLDALTFKESRAGVAARLQNHDPLYNSLQK